MNKSELIDAISGSSGVGKGDVDSVLKALEEVVTSAVCGGGDKISLSGFLTFERTYRNPRTGRNPQTGETIQIAASKTPGFKAGKQFKDALN